MAQHARVINGRLLLAGHRPWNEWRADELLDVCDVLRQEELRFYVSLKIKIDLPDLPDVDVTRIAVRSSAGIGYIDYTPPPAVVDDGTWGLEPDSWQPEGDRGE